MKPGTIFISHRAEYGNLVRVLKKAIETTSRGKIEAIISEDLPGARRPAFWHQGGYSRNSSIHRLRRARASRRPPAMHDVPPARRFGWGLTVKNGLSLTSSASMRRSATAAKAASISASVTAVRNESCIPSARAAGIMSLMSG